MADAVNHPHRWTEEQIATLRRLARPQTLFMKEIAEKMGIPVARVAHKARQLGIVSKPSGRMGKWNTKHAHLREPAMRYFLTHTWEETRHRFGLSQSELKSLFTISYRLPQYRHLRKDRRRRDAWSLDEQLFFLRHAGLRERRWIAKKLNRGGMHAIKDNCSDRLQGIWTKQMHGLPLKTVRECFGLDLPALRTEAGPISDTHSYRYLIVPWSVIADAIKWKHGISPELRGIRTLAKFQKWIYGVHTTRGVISRMEMAIGGKLVRFENR